MRFRCSSTCWLLLQFTETYLVSRQFCLLQTLSSQWLLQVEASGSYLEPEHEHVPQGTTYIIQGHILLKQTFKSKPRF